MIGLSNISLNLTPAGVGKDILLFQETSVIGNLKESWKYNTSTYCQITSLNVRTRLNSYPLNNVPNIYPEDGYYQRWAKKQASMDSNSSFKLKLFLKYPNGTKMSLGNIMLPNYGASWTENLLLEILQTQRESLGLGSGVELWCRTDSALSANDEVYIFGLAKWQIDTLPIDPILEQPQYFHIAVSGTEPTLIVPSNSYRYRIHIQNVGDAVWWKFGDKSSCVVQECSYLPNGGAWEEETLKFTTTQPIWAIAESGTGLLVGFEQSLVY